jgi:hypothetical protein
MLGARRHDEPIDDETDLPDPTAGPEYKYRRPAA